MSNSVISSGVVEIVYDSKKAKLRAKLIGPVGGWVAFPNNLRQLGKTFKVEKIIKSRGDSWKATGQITELKVA